MKKKIVSIVVVITFLLIGKFLLSHKIVNSSYSKLTAEVKGNIDTKEKIATKEKPVATGKIKLPMKKGTIKQAIKIMGDKLCLPSFIQNKFKLVKIEIPEDESNKKIGIMLKYQYCNNDETSFVLRVKELNNITKPAHNAEKLDILGANVYIVCYEIKNSGKYNATLNFIYKDLEYSLVANKIEKDIILKVTKSIISKDK